MTANEICKLIRKIRDGEEPQPSFGGDEQAYGWCDGRKALCGELLAAINAEPAYIAICVGHWGRGGTPTEAVARMHKEAGRRRGQVRYQVYKVHPETWVDQMGNWVWPGDVEQRPEKIEEYKPGERKKSKRT